MEAYLVMYCLLSINHPFEEVINYYKKKLTDVIPSFTFNLPTTLKVRNIHGDMIEQPFSINISDIIKEWVECSFCHSTWMSIAILIVPLGWISIPVSYFIFYVLKKIT